MSVKGSQVSFGFLNRVNKLLAFRLSMRRLKQFLLIRGRNDSHSQCQSYREAIVTTGTTLSMLRNRSHSTLENAEKLIFLVL